MADRLSTELKQFVASRAVYLCDHVSSVSEIGEVTARLFRFNEEERIIERQALNAIGRYPSPEAKARIQS